MLGVTVIDKLGLNNSAAVVVVVGQSALVAAIDGGDRNIGASETLTLNAGASYDPDVPTGAEIPLGQSGAGALVLSNLWLQERGARLLRKREDRLPASRALHAPRLE